MLSALEEATGSFPEAVKICGKLLGRKAGSIRPHSTMWCSTRARSMGARFTGKRPPASRRRRLIPSGSNRLVNRCPMLSHSRDLRCGFHRARPGSLFTSIIPNLLVPASPKRSSVRKQRPSSYAVLLISKVRLGPSAIEHVDALRRHGIGRNLELCAHS